MALNGHRSDDDDAWSPRLSDPTDIEPMGAFDSTDRHVTDDKVDIGPRTQLSDPPTSVVRRESFRELPPGSVVADTYEIDARLGAGAMGEVYAARHIKLGKRVAIKVISKRLSEDDAAIERFAMEARTLAQIQHPAIVAVEHVGELADGRAYFSMELLRGESLFERLQRGRIPLPEALRILDQMARGLDAAHGEGVTHRDVKPENTFLAHLPGEPPVVKIVDFGLAKLRVPDPAAERTQSGVAIGTPMYMSPEQMRGQGVDYRTDIYALGAVAYELVLGQPPFPHARTAPELYAAHLHEAPPLPRSIWPEIPPQLDLVLFAMLAKDPEHRPTLAQVRAVLADARTSTPSQRAATEFVSPRAAKPRRRTLAIAAAVIAALIGGITIGTTVGKRPSGVPLTTPTNPPPNAAGSPAIQPPPVELPAPPPVEVPVTADRKPTLQQQSRSAGSASRPTARQTPKASSTASAPVAPVDAGVDAPAEENPPPPTPNKPVPKTKSGDQTKSVDRNQTIDPFVKKRLKVNP